MNKLPHVLLVGLLCAANFVSAQVYDGSNFPTNGSQYTLIVDSMGGYVSANNLLESAPWYFPSSGSAYANTYDFLDPISTSFGSNYPSASFALIDSFANNFFSTLYFENIAGSFFMIGGVANPSPSIDLPMVYDQPLMWLQLPIQVGAFGYDTAVSHLLATGAEVDIPADSIRYVHTVYRHDTVDAVGNLAIPGFILENVIRRVRTDSIVDSLFTKNSGVWSYDLAFNEDTDVEISVEWFHADHDWIVAQAIIDSGMVQSFRYIQSPPLSVRLELSGLPTDIAVHDTIPSFQATAYDVSTGLIVTDLTDSIHIAPYIDTTGGFSSWSVDELSIMPVSGVATFENLRFYQPGSYRILAFSDTLLSDTSHVITVHPTASHLGVSVSSLSVNENDFLSTITVSALRDDELVDELYYQGSVRVGKLSGSGELLGTLTQPLVNGVATFDDLQLTHQGQYELVFFVPHGQNYLLQDTTLVSVSPNPGSWLYQYTDTLSEYVDRANEFIWVGNADGFLSGTSRGSYSEVGQHFDFEGTARLTKILCHFAGRQIAGSSVDTFEFRIYDAGLAESAFFVSNPDQPGFMDSVPITLLGSQTFLADSIHFGDYWIRNTTTIEFETPPTVNSSFIVSLVGNIESANDTIILWHSVPGDGQQEYRTLHLMNIFGAPQDTMWVRTAYWRPSFDVDLMIEPVLEIDTLSTVVSIAETQKIDVEIYPNPTSDIINLKWNLTQVSPVHLEVYAGSRRVISKICGNKTNAEISLGHLSAGSYIVRLRDKDGLLLHTEPIVRIK